MNSHSFVSPATRNFVINSYTQFLCYTLIFIHIRAHARTNCTFLPLVFMIYEKGLFGNDYCFMILLGIMGAGFLAPVTIKNPSIKGKAVLVVLGITELIVLLLKAKAGAV